MCLSQRRGDPVGGEAGLETARDTGPDDRGLDGIHRQDGTPANPPDCLGDRALAGAGQAGHDDQHGLSLLDPEGPRDLAVMGSGCRSAERRSIQDVPFQLEEDRRVRARRRQGAGGTEKNAVIASTA